MEPATWVIAAFTIVLAVATIWDAWVTRNLLRQSAEAFKQSSTAFDYERKAFRSNIISQIMFSAAQLAGNTHTRQYTWSFVKGMMDALNKTDKHTYQKIEAALEAWRKGKGGQEFEWIFNQVFGEKKPK